PAGLDFSCANRCPAFFVLQAAQPKRDYEVDAAMAAASAANRGGRGQTQGDLGLGASRTARLDSERKTMTLTGKGKTEKRANPASLLLFNFDIDGDKLKEEHKAFLRVEAVPAIRAGSSISVIGLADRLGGTKLHAHNQVLSQNRAAR